MILTFSSISLPEPANGGRKRTSLEDTILESIAKMTEKPTFGQIESQVQKKQLFWPFFLF